MKLAYKGICWRLAGVAGVALGLTGCATTVKPSYVDTSGGKIKSVVVYAKFKNSLSNSPSDEALSAALSSAICKGIADKGVQCESAVAHPNDIPAVSTINATHLIIVNGDLNEASFVTPPSTFWNSCANFVNNQCQGAMVTTPGRYIPTRMSMTSSVIAKQNGKTIFLEDKPQSFGSDESDAVAAARNPAKALIQGLKSSGLL